MAKILRTSGLVILIVCVSASAAIDFFRDNLWWGIFKVVVALIVIGFEIVSYLKDKETISTKQKKFMIRDWFWGGLSLALFALSLAGLILHLAVW